MRNVLSVEVSPCRCDGVGGIEAVHRSEDAEFWTVYVRELNDRGDTLACAIQDCSTRQNAELLGRTAAAQHNVPYTGVLIDDRPDAFSHDAG